MKDFTGAEKAQIDALMKERGSRVIQSEAAQGRIALAIVRGVPMTVHVIECRHEPAADTHVVCHAAVVHQGGLDHFASFDVDPLPTWERTMDAVLRQLELEVDQRDEERQAMESLLHQLHGNAVPVARIDPSKAC